jgi:proline dehydrogenase
MVVVAEDRAMIDKDLETLGQMASRLRAVGGDVAKLLADLSVDLRSVFHDYSKLRTNAMESIHSDLIAAMDRSSVAQVYYYCPKCCCVPEYFYRRIGIHPAEAHKQA